MKKKFDNRGFTLMELLVAISIFSLLTTFVVASYASNEKSRLLKLEASKVLVGLQKAENMAITGQFFDSFIPAVYEFSLSDCSNDCFYILSAKDASGNSKELERQELKGVSIDILNSNNALFRFLPPRGRLEILANENLQSSIKVGLGDEENSYCLEASSVSDRIGLKEGACQ